MALRGGIARRWWVIGAAVVVLVVAILVAYPHLQVYTGAAPPRQFSSTLYPRAAADPAHVRGVAHNAGNNPTTAATAIAQGADVVEIDVISVRGRLAAGRVQPWPWLAERVFRGPTLAQAWASAAPADTVKFDLRQKRPNPARPARGIRPPAAANHPVMVSTRDRAALLYLRPRLPTATLLATTAFPDAVQRLRSDPALIAAVNGVSAFQGLVSPSLVTWAHQRGLLVVAWTVNDGQASP